MNEMYFNANKMANSDSVGVLMNIGQYIEGLEKQQDEIIQMTNEINARLDEIPREEISNIKCGNSYLLRLCDMTSRNAKLIQTLSKILEIL